MFAKMGRSVCPTNTSVMEKRTVQMVPMKVTAINSVNKKGCSSVKVATNVLISDIFVTG